MVKKKKKNTLILMLTIEIKSRVNLKLQRNFVKIKSLNKRHFQLDF